MIPRAHITHWRSQAPWSTDAQVEQDLVLSRAIIELFGDPLLAGQLAFRGGTALHKLFLSPPGRYSEDIDLVQMEASPIGPIVDRLRSVLSPWLGEPKRKFGEGIATLVFRFESETPPITPLRLKVEINTREHFSVLGHVQVPFAVTNPWFSGTASLTTFPLEELLGTKLRALYQRRKGRDLFDLWLAMHQCQLDSQELIRCFSAYLEHGNTPIDRQAFTANLVAKLADVSFRDDVLPLLSGTYVYDPVQAAEAVQCELLNRLP